MINIYEYSEIAAALSALLKSSKLSARTLAQQCDIHPSYFSRFIAGNANLSQIQLFRIAQFLELKDEDTDYLFLMWNAGMAQERTEKEFFKRKLLKRQEQKQVISGKINAKLIRVENNSIDAELYYQNIFTALIHMCLTIPKFRNNSSLIAAKLGISESKLSFELKKLSDLQLIRMKSGTITHVEESIHLPEDAHISTVNHVNWRLHLIQNLQQREAKAGDYHLSVAFSADEETKFKLKQLLRDFVVEAQSKVGQCSTPQEIYHLCMDLF